MVPFPKSWWVESPHFLAGCYPGDPDPHKARAKLVALLEAGIRVFLSLQEEEETGAGGKQFAPYQPVILEIAESRAIQVCCERFPVPDCGVPDPAAMISILDRIDTAIGQKLPVYLHCWGGHGRTATVVGCWLVRHGLSGEDALARIKELRRNDAHLRGQPAPQTSEQRQLVQEWDQHDRVRGR